MKPKKKVWEDPIVAEVRKVKEQLAAKFNYDIEAMFRDIQKREKTSGRHYVDLSKPKQKLATKKNKR